ncbi:protein of unknown function (plasmid) [Cupriavidus taiwanensis]|uniref:Uncharacterized protein n=1 Tax=Cupriavidus taiwanensis TaxID=164546 RepID=A0A375EDJ9_9BURK|nr:protein of unknown function [Cupriavidus taiwanensis]SOZ72473.1 protein of unknown function [Cupriavidus taiwanensis]SOZ74897.1 protein of unknown function [Cupriavidus taiwanensis]
MRQAARRTRFFRAVAIRPTSYPAVRDVSMSPEVIAGTASAQAASTLRHDRCACAVIIVDIQRASAA